MAFMQIIEFETDSVDEMVRLGAEWSDRAVAAGATARRGIVGTDRDKPGRCFQIVFFDSYESAMKNSDLPITHEFAQKMGALAKGEASFYNLDIVDDRTW